MLGRMLFFVIERKFIEILISLYPIPLTLYFIPFYRTAIREEFYFFWKIYFYFVTKVF